MTHELLRATIRWFPVCFLIFLCAGPSFSQTLISPPAHDVIVRKIYVSGNKKTRTGIILREIPFREGDTLQAAKAAALLQTARTNIYNTQLFLTVDLFHTDEEEGSIDVYVAVKERWYTIPIPYVELADRSFNVWWKTYNADLRRLSYGIKFEQHNLTGRNDDLNVLATAGFNRQLEADYTTPYLNQQMRSRMRLGFSVLSSKEIAIMTSDSNKLQYHQSDRIIRRSASIFTGFILRRHIKKKEWITFSHNTINLFDSVRIYNPDFFKDGNTKHDFQELEYRLRYDDVDNSGYPLRGIKYETILSKRGWGWSGGLNRLQASGNISRFISLGHSWYSAVQARARLMLPFEQPYFNSKALGYGNDYIRGYELYVIDGVASFVTRAEIKKQILSIEVPTFLNSKSYSKIPFTLYLKMFGDMGAAHSRHASLLGNKMLYGGGIGFDIVTFHDLGISFNFSLNSLGETGFFVHAD